jgi:nucleoside-diphosphate-sugar epimerase
LKNLTDWQSSYSFSEGIAETIAWFKNPENLKAYKSGIYNV